MGGRKGGTHLAGACLGQVRDDVHFLRRGERANDFAHLENELLRESTLIACVILELAVAGQAKPSAVEAGQIIVLTV